MEKRSPNNNTKKIISTLILSAVIILCIVLIPYLLGFAGTGFTEQTVFQEYMVYAYFGVGALLGIIILFFIETLIKEKDGIYGDGLGFSSQGEFPSTKFFGKFSAFQIGLATVIIITVLGFANFLTVQQSFFDIGKTAQQFTPVNNLVFQTFLVPASENLGIAFVIAIYIFSLRYYCRKHKVSKQNFYIFALIGTIVLSGAYGFGMHQIVYGGKENSLLNTMAIWVIGGLATFFIGSFVVFWMLHLINNLFINLKSFFPNETIIVIFVFVIGALVALYWFLYIRKNKKGGKNIFNIVPK